MSLCQLLFTRGRYKHEYFLSALICYKQKCKVVSLNLAHPVYCVHLDFISLECILLNSLSSQSAVELNEIIASSVLCYSNW